MNKRWRDGALLAALLTGTAGSQAVVIYDAGGDIAAVTGVTIRDGNGDGRLYDVNFIHATYQNAYPGAGYTGLPPGWEFDWQGSLRAWAGILTALDAQGAARVPFAGDQAAAYVPWLNTGIQLGYPCAICLRTSYAYLAPSSDSWSFGGLRWVRTEASGRYPADAHGPLVTWVDITRAVPEPPAAWTLLAGLALLGAGGRGLSRPSRPSRPAR